MTVPYKIKPKRKISWETFEKKYLTREDGYRYEWLNGTIEKTKKMNKQQLFIVINLLAHFRNLRVKQKVKGDLVPEVDLFFKEHHRRPDICWFTNAQANQLANGENIIPSFVIEIISSNDVINKVEQKMNDYRAAEVKTVWHIFPNHQSVHVYTGEKLENMTVHTENMICSAAPGLENFKMKTSDIFKKLPEDK